MDSKRSGYGLGPITTGYREIINWEEILLNRKKLLSEYTLPLTSISA